jgi:hypothetical protein
VVPLKVVRGRSQSSVPTSVWQKVVKPRTLRSRCISGRDRACIAATACVDISFELYLEANAAANLAYIREDVQDLNLLQPVS